MIHLHEASIGECATCEQHIPATEPGFVIDFGSCKKFKKFFQQKACGLRKIDCPDYAEISIEDLKKELSELKTEHTSDKNRTPFEQFILNRFERKE